MNEAAENPRYIAAGRLDRDPLVLVLHEVWGMDDHIVGVCERLGREGYSAVAPTLYWRHGDLFTPAKVREAMRAVWDMPIQARFDPAKLRARLDLKRASGDVRRLLTLLYRTSLRRRQVEDVVGLMDRLHPRGKGVGVIGFSYGGSLAFMLAGKPGRVKLAVTFSAPPPTTYRVRRLACPLLAFYGAKDRFATEGVDRFVSDCDKFGKDLTLKTYDHVGHEFFKRGSPQFDPRAEEDSWALTLRYLEKL